MIHQQQKILNIEKPSTFKDSQHQKIFYIFYICNTAGPLSDLIYARHIAFATILAGVLCRV